MIKCDECIGGDFDVIVVLESNVDDEIIETCDECGKRML